MEYLVSDEKPLHERVVSVSATRHGGMHAVLGTEVSRGIAWWQNTLMDKSNWHHGWRLRVWYLNFCPSVDLTEGCRYGFRGVVLKRKRRTNGSDSVQTRAGESTSHTERGNSPGKSFSSGCSIRTAEDRRVAEEVEWELREQDNRNRMKTELWRCLVPDVDVEAKRKLRKSAPSGVASDQRAGQGRAFVPVIYQTWSILIG